MMEVGDVLIAEYEELMAESRLHSTTASAIVSLEVASLGVGIPVATNHPYVFPALAGITLVLWLRYLDHVSGIFRVAVYVAVELRRKLVAATGDSDVFGWEVFFRRLRKGTYAYHSVRYGKVVRHPRDRGGEKVLGLGYTTLVFGLTPPLMLLAFLFRADKDSGHLRASTVVTCVAGLILWGLCIARWRIAEKWISGISFIITDADPAAGGHLAALPDAQ